MPWPNLPSILSPAMSAATPMSEHERFYVPNRPIAKMNPLLVRSDVGLQRRSTYKLPPADFCYGKPGGADAESAGAIALNWVGFQPNAAEQGARNFVRLNRDATVAGCVNATQATKYRDDHDARIAKAGGNNARAISAHKKFLEGKEFGQKSGAPEKMSKIVSNEFAAKWIQTAEQILHAKNSKPRGSLPLPLPTKSSTGLVQATAGRKFAPPKKIFVMKRFQNIAGKMTRADMFRDASPASATTAAAEADAAATQ